MIPLFCSKCSKPARRLGFEYRYAGNPGVAPGAGDGGIHDRPVLCDSADRPIGCSLLFARPVYNV